MSFVHIILFLPEGNCYERKENKAKGSYEVICLFRGLRWKNIQEKKAIRNQGFLVYNKYRCLYKHISNSFRNILKWFAGFEKVVSLQSNL